ncbi:uncharacterized protein TNIN_345981 [Trichonephila inaurata madagascariensis]|uniref:Uncharacterized protein n=1 Tax=Trichonephila inaurata madagascariensis TaxID=2747483 RepID=A0A8X6XI92_9ARAC|nr:uncharacterized protein TNIN_345981 [Trichonephila inaurata madagascariensis]
MEKLVKVLVFPFTIAFAALDICLHLNRPKDAYKVFQSFSWKIPEDLKEKSEIRNQQFGYLLELTKQLHFVNSLRIGSVAFSDLFLKTKEFSLEELNGMAADIQVIYNKYLISFINAEQLPYVLEFYHYSEESKNDVFIINHQVLRGLVVYFAQNNLLNDARKLFSMGCSRKIYDFEQEDEFVWNLIIMTSWTMFEVNFAVETFIKLIMKALNDECKTNFGEKSVMTIVFKESENNDSEIDCLNVYHRNIESIKKITCNILKSMQVVWTECKNPTSLVLILEKMCNYYERTSDLNKNLVMKKDGLQSKIEFSSSVKESNEKLPVQYRTIKPPSDSLMSEYPVADISCILSPKLITKKSTHEMSFDSAISGNLRLGNSVPVILESIKPFPSKKIHLSSHFTTPEQEQEVTSSDQIISRSSSVQMFPEKGIVAVNTQMSSEKMHSASTDEFTLKNTNNSVPRKQALIISTSKILRKYKKLSYLKNIKFATHKIILSKKYEGMNKMYFKKDAVSSYNETISDPSTSEDVKPPTVLGPIKKLSPAIFKNAGKFKITLASSAQNVGRILAPVAKSELSKSDHKMPAVYLSLNTIEHLWDKVERFLQSFDRSPFNLSQLCQHSLAIKGLPAHY